MKKDGREEFESWHARKYCDVPIEWQLHLNRFFYGGVQTRWEIWQAAWTARAARERELREALVAAVPWLFEHGAHQSKQCHRGSDDGCLCGLDESKKIVVAALTEDSSDANSHT